MVKSIGGWSSYLPQVEVQEIHKKNRYEVFFNDDPEYDALRLFCHKIEKFNGDWVKFSFYDLADNSIYKLLNKLSSSSTAIKAKIVAYAPNREAYELITITGLCFKQDPIIDFDWSAGGDMRFLSLTLVDTVITSIRE